MSLDTTFLRRCLDALERALEGLRHHGSDDVFHEVFRAACVKEFELVLEQSGKLLKKRLRPWFASNRQADRLAFKDAFRHAARHGLIDADACERWLRRGHLEAVAGLPDRRRSAGRHDRCGG